MDGKSLLRHTITTHSDATLHTGLNSQRTSTTVVVPMTLCQILWCTLMRLTTARIRYYSSWRGMDTPVWTLARMSSSMNDPLFLTSRGGGNDVVRYPSPSSQPCSRTLLNGFPFDNIRKTLYSKSVVTKRHTPLKPRPIGRIKHVSHTSSGGCLRNIISVCPPDLFYPLTKCQLQLFQEILRLTGNSFAPG